MNKGCSCHRRQCNKERPTIAINPQYSEPEFETSFRNLKQQTRTGLYHEDFFSVICTLLYHVKWKFSTFCCLSGPLAPTYSPPNSAKLSWTSEVTPKQKQTNSGLKIALVLYSSLKAVCNKNIEIYFYFIVPCRLQMLFLISGFLYRRPRP